MSLGRSIRAYGFLISVIRLWPIIDCELGRRYYYIQGLFDIRPIRILELPGHMATKRQTGDICR